MGIIVNTVKGAHSSGVDQMDLKSAYKVDNSFIYR